MTTAEGPTPFVDEGLGNSSYLVDLGDGRALVVDPARHPGRYLAAAERRGLDIAYALETHLHADFVSGGRELAALGATLLAPAAGGHEFPVRPVAPHEEVDLGGFTLRALPTPGHTPEHLAYLLLDGPSPVALFSGGSLLVDAVARTDLIAPEETESLARSLWRSLHDHVLSLPDGLPVYPTHGAGSFCSAPASGDRTTTIGRERRANPLLLAPSEDAFVEQLLGSLGSYPPYFLRLRAVNRRGPHLYGPAPPVLPAVAPAHVRRLERSGAWLVDVRPVEAFAAAHVPGSVSIPLRPQFASWLGWVVPEQVPVVFVLDPEQDRTDVVRQARGIGYEALLGELDGGIVAWRAAGFETASMPIVPVEAVTGQVIDVRQRPEFEAGHVPGSRNVELGDIADTDLPTAPVALMCGHGERAMTAASLLSRERRGAVTVVVGGPGDWAHHHGALDPGS